MGLIKAWKHYGVWSLVWILVLAYCVLYAPKGWEDTDSGFITALSWRIFQGQIPYQDFIYVRPPASLYLHTLSFYVFPQNYVILAERWLFYFSIFIYNYLIAKLLTKYLFPTFSIQSTVLLTAIGFIFSVHNFNPMAWHTIDGILFASLGAFFVFYFWESKQEKGYLVAGSLAFFVAVLCKQSFYPLPILVIFIFVLHQKWQKLGWFLGASAIYLTLFFAILSHYQLVSAFVSQTTGVTHLSDVILAGGVNYLKKSLFLLPYLILFGIKYKTKTTFSFLNDRFWILLFTFLFLAGVGFITVYQIYVQQKDSAVADYYPQSLWVLSMVIFGYDFYQKRLSLLITSLLFLLLGIAWCSSISWGYTTPVLCILPCLAGMIYLFSSGNTQFHFPQYAIILMLGGLIIFFIGYQKPYRDGWRNELLYKMEKTYPLLSGIDSDHETFMKYQELQFFSKKYPQPQQTLPSVTLFHFLSQTTPILPLDRFTTAEIGTQSERVKQAILAYKGVFFIEIDKLSTANSSPFGSPILSLITPKAKHIETGKYFAVYQF